MVILNSFSKAASINEIDKAALLAYKGGVANGTSSSFSEPLDAANSIDPIHYLVGPGDRFRIAVIDIPSLKLEAIVDNRRNLYLPDVGLIELGKVTLIEAQDRIAKNISEKLKQHSQVYVTLTEPKKATITVNGAVANPGTRTMSGGFHLLDAIRAANNDQLPSMNDCNYREVRCTGQDSAATYDLFEYLLRSDLSQNPYIYPGDNINISLAERRIIINGPIKSMVGGWIPIKKDENIGHLLSFFRFDESADTASVIYQTGAESVKREIKKMTWDEASSVKLQDCDVIAISRKTNYPNVNLIYVSGEVTRPGVYPFIRDSTTVEQILVMAGGITEFADSDRIALIHANKVSDSKLTEAAMMSKTELAQIVSVRPEMSAGISRMNMTLDYSVVELKQNGSGLLLSPGDRISVPKKDPFVYISGSVRNPGSYKFEKGKDASFYISKAGGYADKADITNKFGLRFYEGVAKVTDLHEIAAGDVIVIPDSQQAKMLTTVILPVLQVILTTVSVALGIFSITR